MGYSFAKTGTSHWGTVANATANNLGTADFCVECWVNVTSFSGSSSAPVLWCKANSTPVGWFGEISASTIWFGYQGVGSTYTSWSYGWSTSAWRHIAFTRTGSTLNCYVNGVGLGSATVSNAHLSYDNTNDWIIGAYSIAGTYHLNGYLSNLRVSKGTRRYTSNFTPSTTALTADADTVLLTAQSATFVDNSSTAATVASTGAGFTISSLSPFGMVYSETSSGGAELGGVASVSVVSRLVGTGGAELGGFASVSVQEGQGVTVGGTGSLRWCVCEPEQTTYGVVVGGSSVTTTPNPYDLYHTVLPLDERSQGEANEFRDRCGTNHGQGAGGLPTMIERGVACLPYQLFTGDSAIILNGDPIDPAACTISCFAQVTDERNAQYFYDQGNLAFGWSFLQYPRASVNQVEDEWADDPLTPGKWYHLALVVESNVVTFYVNGVPRGEREVSIITGPRAATISKNGWCSLQEIRIAPVAFSQAWIATEYDSMTLCDFVIVGEETDISP